VEEDDAYFTGDTDPFCVEKSEQAMVVCPFEEMEETEDFPPWDASVGSAGLCNDKPEKVFVEASNVVPASVVCVAPSTVLKGRLELYMFTDVFGDDGVLCVATTEPLANECIGEVLDV